MATKRGPSKNLTKKMKQDIESVMSRAAERGLSSLDQAFQEQIQKHHLQADSNRFISAQRDALRKQAVSMSLKAINSANIPSDYKRAEIAAVTNAGFPEMSQQQRMQMGEVSRKTAESLFRTQLRQTELSRNPFVQASQIKKLIESNEGDVGPNSRAMIDAKKKLASAEDSAASAQDLTKASLLRQRVTEMGGSAASKIDFLSQMKTTESGDKTLKEIEKLLREQNKIVSADKDNFEKATREHPIVSSLFGDMRGGPNGPGTMTAAQMQRIQNMASTFQGIGAAASAVATAGNEFLRSGVRAEEKTFLSVAARQALTAQRNMDILGNFSGEGLIKKYGDILLKANETRYTGFSGMQQAAQDAKGYMQETRAQEMRDALLGGGKAVLGGALSLGGALLAPTGLGIPIAAAGLGLMASGSSDLFNNRAVQETGILGQRRQRMAQEGRLLEAEETAKRLTDADVARQLFATRSLDQAISLRQADAEALVSMGSGAVSFRRQLSDRFMNNASRYTDFQRSTGQVRFEDEVRGVAGPDDSILTAAASLGYGAQEFTTLANRAAMSFDQKYQGDPGQTALMLRKLQLSGRGSIDQLLGNIQTLNQVSGGQSDKKLETIFSKAVESGFKGARLGQEFANAVTENMRITGSTDVQAASERMGLLTALSGGGERGFMFGRSAISALGAMSQNELVGALGNAYTTQAFAGLDQRKLSSITDTFARMDVAQQGEAAEAVRKALEMKPGKEADEAYMRLTPEQKLIYSSLSGRTDASDMLKQFQRGRAVSVFGGEEGFSKFQASTQNIRSKKGAELIKALNAAMVESGATGLQGFSAESIAAYGASFLDLTEEQKKSIGIGKGGKGTDQGAVGRFQDLNKLNARRLMFENAQAGGGESLLSRSILDDLVDRGRVAPIGKTIQDIAKDRQIDLQRMGNLGTRYSTNELSKIFQDQEKSARILGLAGSMQSGSTAEEASKASGIKYSEAEKEIAAALASQTKMDVIDRMESERLGIDKISMVSILPSSATFIAEEFARAMGVKNTQGPPGNNKNR